MTTETVTGPFLLVLTAEQIPLLNDCIYEGVTHADHEDLEAMVMFRSALQTQLDEGAETAEAVRRLKAITQLAQGLLFEHGSFGMPWPESDLGKKLTEALEDETLLYDWELVDELLGATP